MLMRKFKIIICLYLALLLLNSCGTVKKGFQNPKKNSTDEFLVEKKSPLVMPPDFSKLPVPSEAINQKSEEDNSIEELINDNSLDESSSEATSSDLEGSIIDKIKN